MLYKLKDDYESLTLIDKISNVVMIMLMSIVNVVGIFNPSMITVGLLWKDVTRFYDVNAIIKYVVTDFIEGLMAR